MCNPPAKILICHCAYSRTIPQARLDAVVDALCSAGVEFSQTNDLCELSAGGDALLKKICSGPATIVACYERAVRALFDHAGAPLPAEARVINLRRTEPDEAVEHLLSERPADQPAAMAAGPGAPGLPCHPAPTANMAAGEQRPLPCHPHDQLPPLGAWVPWFPVIDKSRCTNCKQCLNFCLFGVYALDGDGRVTVQNPEQCKTNCPACARVCPATAIIFPKFSAGPINGGEPGPDNDAQPVNLDFSHLLSGDVYEKLRQRTQGKKAE